MWQSCFCLTNRAFFVYEKSRVLVKVPSQEKSLHEFVYVELKDCKSMSDTLNLLELQKDASVIKVVSRLHLIGYIYAMFP